MKMVSAFLVVCIFVLSYNGIVFSKNMQNYDYVIITTDDLQNSLINFTQWKETMGYNVKTVTTSWIESNYKGNDIQEKIRNFLIDKYEEWGINYVLIAGSRNKIPMRECYPLRDYHENDYMVPTDYYYADLTGDWDGDGDSYFGEITQDKPDFYPEVYVGRMPSDDTDKMKSMCERIINFEKNNGAWKKNVLLLGAIIFYENQSQAGYKLHRSDGATLMEECRKDIFEPNGLLCTTMYEKKGIRPSIYEYDYPLNHSNVLSEWKKGYGIVNMLGHASNVQIDRLVWDHDDGNNIPEYPGELKYIPFLRGSDSDDLSIEKPPIVYTSGCYQLWTSRNIGRVFMEDGAAVAFIGSTAGSWYNISLIWNNEDDGGTYSINYYFFYYLINYHQKCGNALYNSKEYYYNNFIFTRNNREWIFRCYDNLYGFNLYGDPSMGLSNEKVDANPPEVSIQQPENGIYIFGNKIIPFPVPLIIGSINVKATVSDESGIERVEFYLENHLKASMEKEPYEWEYNGIGFHKIKVVAIDSNGNIGGAEINVFSL
ncbi:MAG TPA: hypothetical protein ENI33_02595 [Thermoplasmatales archaeon]|nr:hypothetical protein [Thermoplasmatales archaeon]